MKIKYPNPVTNYINISIVGQLQYNASIYDLSGRIIKEVTNKRVISTISIPPGTYFLEIKDLLSGDKIVEKIIIQ